MEGMLYYLLLILWFLLPGAALVSWCVFLNSLHQLRASKATETDEDLRKRRDLSLLVSIIFSVAFVVFANACFLWL